MRLLQEVAFALRLIFGGLKVQLDVCVLWAKD
jgi:hypothetical protein